jgi:hypothetical protein
MRTMIASGGAAVRAHRNRLALLMLAGAGVAIVACGDRVVDLGDWNDASAADAAVADARAVADVSVPAVDASIDGAASEDADASIANSPECPTTPPTAGEPCTVGREADGGCSNPPVQCIYPDGGAPGTSCTTMSCLFVDNTTRWICGVACP